MTNYSSADLRRAADWFKAAMGMEDWAFDITLADEPPGWVTNAESTLVGRSSSAASSKRAQLWVSDARTRREFPGQTALDTLFHEQLHAVLEDCGILAHRGNHHNNRRVEFLLDRLSGVLCRQYLAEKKAKSRRGRGK